MAGSRRAELSLRPFSFGAPGCNAPVSDDFSSRSLSRIPSTNARLPLRLGPGAVLLGLGASAVGKMGRNNEEGNIGKQGKGDVCLSFIIGFVCASEKF